MRTIRPAVPADADDPALVARLTHLINAAYAQGERGMWQPGASRTTTDEVATLLRQEGLLLAFDDDRLVGSVAVVRWDDHTAELGMLSADTTLRGQGIGRDLLAAAEAWGRSHGRRSMRLEILTPHGFDHPDKVFLRDWYTRQGYAPESLEPIDERFAHLASLLAVPCDLVVYRKAI